MKSFDSLPRSLKKTIRFIRQDATLDQIKQLELFLAATIHERKMELSKDAKKLPIRKKKHPLD